MHHAARHRWIFPPTAAGLLFCLAACRPAAPSSDGAAASFSAEFPIPTAPLGAASFAPPASSASTPSSVPGPPAGDLVTLSQTDPRAALLASADQNLGPAATYLRGNFLQLWAARDFTAALAYADELPPGRDREEMLARLALVLADALPAEAAGIVAHDMSPGATRDEAAVSVLHRWALVDPASAGAWASAFPAGPLRERALREVAAPPVARAPAR